jgi:hypothetical protein
MNQSNKMSNEVKDALIVLVISFIICGLLEKI